MFTTESSYVVAIASALCSYGATWTAKCREELTKLTAEVAENEGEHDPYKYELLTQGLWLRDCVVHWERQHRDGVTELTEFADRSWMQE